MATLPLLSASFGEDADPSPYRPLSRLFWNEFFLAPEDATSGRLARRRDAWGMTPRPGGGGTFFGARMMVDYRGGHGPQAAGAGGAGPLLLRAARTKRAGRTSKTIFETIPVARDYAAFQARRKAARLRAAAGRCAEGARPSAERYHLYCQWQMDRQLGRGIRRAAGRACCSICRWACIPSGSTWSGGRSSSRRACPPARRRTRSSPADRTGPLRRFTPKRTGATVIGISAPASAT